jgi:uncharacterized protein (DUF1810 family)
VEFGYKTMVLAAQVELFRAAITKVRPSFDTTRIVRFTSSALTGKNTNGSIETWAMSSLFPATVIC